MKKILLIAAVAGLAAVSCSKDRTCTCTNTPVTYTANGVTQPIGSPSTTTTKLTKVSKTSADCNSGEETTTWVSGTVTYTTTCTLK